MFKEIKVRLIWYSVIIRVVIKFLKDYCRQKNIEKLYKKELLKVWKKEHPHIPEKQIKKTVDLIKFVRYDSFEDYEKEKKTLLNGVNDVKFK